MRFNRKLVEYYALTVILILPILILGIVYKFYPVIEIEYGLLALSILNLVAILLKNIFFRTKLTFTFRAKINFIFLSFLSIFNIYVFLIITKKPITFCLLNICECLLFPYIIKFLIFLTNLYFNTKNDKYVLLQKKKLSQKKLLVIGITGSYGKTSCKNILRELLSIEYKVISTEKNFNTPMGIALSIDRINDDDEIFIVEMGARKKGDVAFLCDMVNPTHALITGVTEQHLETFGTIDGIVEEKFCLAKSLPSNGFCVFNTNDKYALRMYKDYMGKKVSACVNKKGEIFATEIKSGITGSEFVLNVDGTTYKVKTKLLGKHNVINIVSCVALAYKLNVPMDKIVKKIETLEPIEHRLEYVYSNGIHILDDGYNANLLGVKSALEVLRTFPGKKIIVSQGIVELGESAERINKLAGVEIAKVADIVIVSGPNAKYLTDGLALGDFNGELIHAKNMKKIQDVLKTTVNDGDTVLLQNDVPDIY